ncbi:MAG: hypothetical protein QM589_13835 [Thermomicrobiales bacterium]
MILIFGTRTFRWSRTTTDYVRTCPRCGFFGRMTRQKQIRTIAVFFVIPLIPLGKVETVDVCPRCGLEVAAS